MKFSANLGFLWTDRPLPDAIRAAHAAGFDAVECHWPYDVPAAEVKAALDQTGLRMLGLNTRRGDVAGGENGVAALPGREEDARAFIDEALAYAVQIGAGCIHVMGGFARGDAALAAYVSNLRYACDAAAPQGITILIEPLNRHDAPGYVLRTTDQAAEIIEAVGAANLKIMFDCYHVGRTEGDVTTRLRALLPMVGHIQFASVPDRGTPDHGELDYAYVFAAIRDLGWEAPLGAEYKSAKPTDETLAWLAPIRERFA
ncbi:Putative hydroxypyruvate isomerase YgbM [Rhodobacteraceae bacterium THAF1]|uniref:hydroxypyruvate isomerase family protein n=1 Tax=Palleronia sp. THAF1 TaxID=2587842 RepID=UPI000F41B714|nr:TIM barrel protein [Palleronia sp. THAF1]QFU09646.1 Putative hydroxypyruvate isomerase YgbM [Palleronia sp. THAF1]VDC17453.1 Putative hydroxypyruvate isomerase YgbM [Rhodobacteraceae bacterium THAF1]